MKNQDNSLKAYIRDKKLMMESHDLKIKRKSEKEITRISTKIRWARSLTLLSFCFANSRFKSVCNLTNQKIILAAKGLSKMRAFSRILSNLHMQIDENARIFIFSVKMCAFSSKSRFQPN